MTKLFLTTALFFLFLSNKAFAQNAVIGQLYNQNNKPLELVEIQLQNKDSLIIKSELTNELGKFNITAQSGIYVLQAKQWGKTLYEKTITLDQNLDLGRITITETAKALQEVVITAKKKLIERKIDRLVFNVENSIAATGGDAIDVLKKTPSIRVQDESISMVGKSNMAVMIDDRIIPLSGQDLTNYLKGIASDNIKSIEIITTPPAKYNAEGSSGLINIKLKKVKNDSWSASVRSTYRQATYPSGTLGNDFNYQKGKTTISTNLNYTNGANYTTETQNIVYPTQNWNSTDNFKNYNNIFSGKFYIDYQLNDKLTFGIQYLGSNGKPSFDENNITVISDINNNTNQSIQTNLSNKKNNLNNSLNFHTIYEIDTIGRKLSLDVDYFNFKRDNNQVFSTIDKNFIGNSNTNSLVNNSGNQNIKNFSTTIDMTHPLKWINLDYGAKVSQIETSSNINYFDLSSENPIFDATKSNKYIYKENNQAIYFSASKKFGKDKWEFQLGLRLENTQTYGFSETLNQNNNNEYSNLFPTFYLNYTSNEDNAFSLNYGKRINRPKYTMLNPFREYSNPYSYVAGNPFLQPSITHNISFGHIFKSNLNSSIYYSYEHNGFSSLTLIDKNSINQITTLLNYFDTESMGLSENYNFDKFKGWESFFALNIYYSKTKANNPNVEYLVDGLGGDISSSNTFTFNESKTCLGNLDILYSFPNTFLNTKNQATFNTDLGIKYLLYHKRITINATISDIFKTNKQRWSQKISDINFYNTNYSDARRFNLTASYKFGDNKLKAKKTEEGNDEEKGRALVD